VKKTELLERIEALEERVAQLESAEQVAEGPTFHVSLDAPKPWSAPVYDAWPRRFADPSEVGGHIDEIATRHIPGGYL
jgi:hypothetical protein